MSVKEPRAPQSPGESRTGRGRAWLARARGHGPGALLLRGASGSFIAKGFAAAAGFALHLVLARMLGATPYGDFTYVFTWMVLLASVARLGLDRAVLRFVPSYEETNKWNDLRGILRFSSRWVWTSSVIAAGLTLPVILWRSGVTRPELTRTFYLGLLCLPLIASVGVREAHLAGFKHPVLASLPFAFIRPIVTLPVFVLAAVMIAPTAGAAMAATGVGTLGALAFTFVTLRRVSPRDSRAAQPNTRARTAWLDTALPLMWAMLMTLIAQRASMLLAGILAGTQAVGLLSAAMRYSDLLLFAQQAVASLATPMFAGMFSTQRHGELQRILSLSTLAASAFALPLGILLLVFRIPLLGFFGPEFKQASPALVWLTLGQLTNALSGLVAALLGMTGHHRVVAQVVTGSAILGVILNVLLIPKLGVTGAAIATAATIACQNIALALAVRRQLGLNSTVFGIIRVLRPRGQ